MGSGSHTAHGNLVGRWLREQRADTRGSDGDSACVSAVGEAPALLGQTKAGLQVGNLIRTHRRSIILKSNSQAYEVVPLLVLLGLEVPM